VRKRRRTLKTIEDATIFHAKCFACGAENPDGLRLRCTTAGGVTRGTIVIDERFQGYDNIAQGGIVATILDTAMVQLVRDLFGGNPRTARLDVRYLGETPLRRLLTVTARLTHSRTNTHWVEAEIVSGLTPCASAQGVFRNLYDADR
jgi:acyl-coenzyme A thioesterase PaaI-like protein